MSIIKRMSDLMQEKLNRILDRAEDPTEALDLSYEKQLEALQKVRRNIADILTAEKRLEIQAAQLQQSQLRLQEQAKQALQQNREDLARLALTRAQVAQQQLEGLKVQIEQLKQQEQNLELTAQKLQAKVEAFRTQKETLKAQYTAAKASTTIGEAVTGLSEQMADVNLIIERAQEKTLQMQARAAAIDQLVQSGTLEQVGALPGQDDITAQLTAGATEQAVEEQLSALKKQLMGGQQREQLPQADTIVVRIQGEGQYRLDRAAEADLNSLDKQLVDAINAGDEAAYKGALTQLLEYVRTKGKPVGEDELVSSSAILPSADMTLDEAKKILEGSTSSS